MIIFFFNYKKKEPLNTCVARVKRLVYIISLLHLGHSRNRKKEKEKKESRSGWTGSKSTQTQPGSERFYMAKAQNRSKKRYKVIGSCTSHSFTQSIIHDVSLWAKITSGAKYEITKKIHPSFLERMRGSLLAYSYK
jgi:hypothetical protein